MSFLKFLIFKNVFIFTLFNHSLLVTFAYKIQNEIDSLDWPNMIILAFSRFTASEIRSNLGKEAYCSCKCRGKHHQKEQDVYTYFFQVLQKRQIISIPPHLKHYILSKWHEMRIFCLETITKSAEVITSIFSIHFFPPLLFII